MRQNSRPVLDLCRLAAALLQAEGGGELRLCYSDDLETVKTDWKKA